MLTFKQYILESPEEYKQQEGESEIVHHASQNKVSDGQFYPLSHFGTKDAARNRVFDSGGWAGKNKPPVFHHVARLKLGNTVEIPDIDDVHTPDLISHALHQHDHITDDELNSIMKSDKAETRKAALLSVLKKKKIHTIAYRNSREDPGSQSYIITHPSQVRMIKSPTEIPYSSLNKGRGEINDEKNKRKVDRFTRGKGKDPRLPGYKMFYAKPKTEKPIRNLGAIESQKKRSILDRLFGRKK